MKAFTNLARGCGLWEMADKDSGECLGWILVREYGIGTDYHTTDIMELGWRLKRDYWGQGLTTEAARVIMNEVAELPGITRFCALADADNLASIAVMKKLGMQYVDERIHKGPKGDFPSVYYDMPNPALPSTTPL
jgi:RimJ/RimL family protein N-acetyltransferase